MGAWYCAYQYRMVFVDKVCEPCKIESDCQNTMLSNGVKVLA